MTFEDFNQKVYSITGFHCDDKGNGHWQLKLPNRINVNFYLSSARRTVYANPVGDFKGLRAENVTEDMAVKLVQELQNKELKYVLPTKPISDDDIT